MNRPLVQCIMETLRVTGPPEGALTRLRTFGKRDWQRTLPWLDESGLGLYLLRRLSHADSLAALPPEIRTQLQHNLSTNQRRLALMKEEFDSLNRHFAAAGVDYVVLKGFALLPEFCPDAALRSQYDYDYLVSLESASAARQVLQARDYSQKVRSPGFQKDDESLFTVDALTIPSPDQNFYSPDIPRTVELHLGLWESERDMIGLETPEDVLHRKRLANWEGRRFPVLADDDGLMFQVLHAFQHLLSYWCRPSCFLEIAHFLAGRQHDTEFWERFRRRVEGHRYLPQIIGLMFSMAETLFQAPLAPEVAVWTTQALSAPLSLWVQRHGRAWSLARFPGSKLSLFVHRMFIEEPETWKEVERSRLFPFHRPAKVVESSDQRLASRWRAGWEQGHFVLSRLKFHLGGLLRYTWELPAWRKHVQRLERTPGSDGQRMSFDTVAGPRSSNFLQVATWGYSLGYLLLAAACLVSWGGSDPWLRFDLFSGVYLLLRTLGSVHSIAAGWRVFHSRQVMQEWWATNSDPGGIQRVVLLMALDLTVLLNYAHWHLWAVLERPTLQACGLTLYAGAMAWQIWADNHLARFFAGGPREAEPMRHGPYRFVRHPRYSASLLGKVAFALIFANGLGWLMVLAWGALLLRKVEVEEAHLRRLFGQGYAAYQQKTARLLPGIY